MQVTVDLSKVPQPQMMRLCEAASEMMRALKRTKEGRRMLREEIELMRREKAERSVSKC